MQVLKSKTSGLWIAGLLAMAALSPCAPAGAATSATVGVYYFEGWYHDAPGLIAAFANEELRNDFPEREPIWGGGLWRGDTVPIMEQQIDLAADHGIAFFSFDWYWYDTPAATSNDGINSGLKHFMLASNRDRMKFNINIVDTGPSSIDSDAEWQQVADMLVTYMVDSQYLRVGGKPFVINFNAAGMTQTNHDYFQQAAAAAGLGSVAFAANVSGSTALYSHLTRYNAVPGWGAGETQYPYQSLTDYVEGNDTWAPGIWNTESGGPQAYIPNVMAGWDARPWGTPPSWYFNDPAWGHTPAAVGAHLQKAIDWIDANPTLATPERLVMIFAWNEFGEGGYLTPTLGDPNGLYLDAIKAVVGVSPPPEPEIDNGVGATGVTHTAAWVTGELLASGGESTDVCVELGSAHGTVETCIVDVAEGPFSVYVTDLAPNTDYAYHCFATNVNGSAWSEGFEWFTTHGDPVVNTGAGATGVTHTTAWLTSELSFTFGEPTDVCFELGSVHGTVETCVVRVADGPFSVHVTDLEGGTLYGYRCSASNANGAADAGGLEFFNTAADPVISTGAGATGVTDTAAWLTGELSFTLGAPTDVAIEWGSAHGTGSTALVYSVDGPFAVHVEDLVPDTPYGYRCSASNVNGAAGPTAFAWFTTAAEPPFVDEDGDGLDDNWENHYFGSITNTAGGADEDADEDRFIDLFEFKAGTDPTNPASLLAVTDLGPHAASDIVIRWYAVSNKVYRLTENTNLLTPWWVLISNIPATPPVNARTVTVENIPAFYRIELEE